MMTTINISTVSSGWILQKISERTSEHLNKIKNVNSQVSHRSNIGSDVNLYFDIQNCYFGEKTKLDIGFFTHADMNSKTWLENLFKQKKVFENMDGIISMNERYTEMIREIGYSNNKIITITPGQTYDVFPLKKIKIGIVSRGGYPGYGQQFMENLFNTKDLKNFEFHFLGSGWKNIDNIAKEKGITVLFEDDINYSIYPEFYNKIDYLLIPGLWTAGPMSFQEALSTGTPVISSDVGFAGYEFNPDFIFKPNDLNGLYEIFEIIQKPLIMRRKQVENMTWSDFASKINSFINYIKK
jgi:glycosyltransferase involved in cell wall biosynthesis